MGITNEVSVGMSGSGLDFFDPGTMERGDTTLPHLTDYRSAVIAMRNSPALYGLFNIAEGGGETVLGLLPRYTVAAAGSREWKMQNSLDGRQQPGLTGVPVMVSEYRVYYDKTMEESAESGGGSLPACSSPNNRIGIGSPGGLCGQCPKRSFDITPNCRGRTRMFLVHPEERYPVLVDITGPVAQGLTQYAMDGLPFGYSMSETVSTFTLTGHPKYRSGNRATSLIVGEAVGIAVEDNDVEYAAALQWLQGTLSFACWQWSNRVGMSPSGEAPPMLVDADGVIVEVA